MSEPARGLVRAGERRERVAGGAGRVERRRERLGPWNATVELTAFTHGRPRYLVSASWTGPPPTGGQLALEDVSATDCALLSAYTAAEQLARFAEDELQRGRVPNLEREQQRLEPDRAPW